MFNLDSDFLRRWQQWATDHPVSGDRFSGSQFERLKFERWLRQEQGLAERTGTEHSPLQDPLVTIQYVVP